MNPTSRLGKITPKFSIQRSLSISSIALLISIILYVTLSLPFVSGHSGDNFEAFTNTSPQIDGIINDDEWASADRITYPIPEGEATIYVMNDQRSLYIAAKIEDNELDEIVNVALDIFTIDFDVRHDGMTFSEGEDTISIGARTRIGDGFVGPSGSILDDGQIDVDGFVSRDNNGFNHFEISHPLDSGDANDIVVQPGDTVGVRFVLFDGSGSDRVTITALPTGLSPESTAQNGWADITIAEPTAPPTEFPITLISIIVLAIAWAAYAGYMIRKRRAGSAET